MMRGVVLRGGVLLLLLLLRWIKGSEGKIGPTTTTCYCYSSSIYDHPSSSCGTSPLLVFTPVLLVSIMVRQE